MSFFNKILEWFDTKATINSYLIQGELGVYKKNTNFRIKKHLAQYSQSLIKPKYGDAANYSSFRADMVEFYLSKEHKWIIPEANISIRAIKESWELLRTSIGEVPQYTIYGLKVEYNQMDKTALLAHLDNIQDYMTFNQEEINEWVSALGKYNYETRFSSKVPITLGNFRAILFIDPFLINEIYFYQISINLSK